MVLVQFACLVVKGGYFTISNLEHISVSPSWPLLITLPPTISPCPLPIVLRAEGGA